MLGKSRTRALVSPPYNNNNNNNELYLKKVLQNQFSIANLTLGLTMARL